MWSVQRRQGMLTLAFGCCCFVVIKAQSSGENRTQPRCDELCDYSPSNQLANCQERGLSNIPVQCLRAKTLDLSLNHIDTLPQGRLSWFPSLRYLYIVNVSLRAVEEGAFQGCDALQLLSWGGNEFSVLRSAWLDGLHNLKFMSLDRSQLQRIEVAAFSQTPSLETLNLSGNKFVSPPCDAFGPDNLLTEFYLNDNLISNIPEKCFEMLSNLQRITLNDNPLGDIRMTAFEGLASLKSIELENTSLSSVPNGALSSVRKVTHLNMARNLITTLEGRDFSVLPEAEYIDLSYNRIRFVHEHAFANMHCLKILKLPHNEIASIGWRAFIPVENTLEELYLQDNQLISISNISASTILSLHTFLLADNPLLCDCHLYEYRYSIQIRLDKLKKQESVYGTCREPDSGRTVNVLASSLTEVACSPVSTFNPLDTTKPQEPTVSTVTLVKLTSNVVEGVDLTKEPTFVWVIIALFIIPAIISLLLIAVCCFKTIQNREHRRKEEEGAYVQLDPAEVRLN